MPHRFFQVGGAMALLCLALTGCYTLTGGGSPSSGGGEWMKAGSDSAATSRDLSACQLDARRSVAGTARVDQDIVASRGQDWQRTGSYQGQVAQLTDRNADRERQYVTACMRTKGYTQPAAK